MMIQRRVMSSPAAAVLLGLLLLDSAAAEPPVPPALLKPIPVPADRPVEWPQGDWGPVVRSELESLVERSRPAPPRPRRTWIESATWTATFDGSHLRGGRLEAVVRHAGGELELLRLEPLNLAVSELRWSEQEAVWGMLSSGEAALLVDGEHKTLNGRWNLSGRTLPQSVEFDLQLPSAVVSRLRITLPEGSVLSASVGDVRQSRDIRQQGLRDWEVDLGSRTDCRLTIHRRRDAPPELPLVLIETNHSYVVGEDAVLLQSQVQVEAAGGPIDRLIFEVPAEVNVHSVTYGNDSPLSWKMSPHGGQRHLTVQLGDPLSGRSRPIRIAGIATSTVGRTFELPRPRLKWASLAGESLAGRKEGEFAGKQPGGVRPPVLLGGQTHVKVEAPLELRSVEASGFRQTAAVSTPGVSFSSSWEQYRYDALLRLEVGYPQLRHDARVVTLVEVSEGNWRATTQIEWSARGGKSFETACRLSPLWEVLDVRPRNPASTLTNWDVQRESGGGRTLLVEFRDAIAPGSPKSVEVVARRLSLPPVRPLRLPVVKPLERGSVEQLIAVSHPASTAPRLEARSGFSAIEPADVPAFAAESKLWQPEDFSAGRSILLLRSSSALAAGRLHLEDPAPAVDARAWITLSLDPLQLEETIAIQFQPRGQPVDRVMVYLTNPAGKFAWTLRAADAKPLPSDLIDVDRHRDWGLPTEGELWEIRLPRPFTSRFAIVGARSQSVAAGMKPTLAVVPRAKSFEGIVEVKTAGGVPVETQMDGPTSVEANALDQQEFAELIDFPPTGRLWTFRSPEQSVLLRLRGGRTGAALRPTAALSLTSVLSDETPGFDRHSAVLRFLGEVRGQAIRFRLPEPAILLSTSLNGRPVPARRRGNDWLLANAEGENQLAVQIEYHAPSTLGRLGGPRSIPLPQFAYEILEFDWQFATPPDFWLVREPTGMILEKPLAELAWTERFFGPLGRPVGRPLYNPFSAAAWGRLDSTATTDSRQDETSARGRFAPPGWTIHRATAPALPPRLALSTRRHSQAWLLAWLATLGCLMFGLLMRARTWAFRKGAFGYWLSGCLLAAWLSPPFYALIAGGCVVGTTVALLFPRRLLEKLRFVPERTADSVLLGSTASFRNAPAALLLVISLMCAAHGLAQDPPVKTVPGNASEPAARRGAAPEKPIRILIPRDNSEPSGENGDIVYVERSRLAGLKRLADRSGAAKYLIAAADYAARVDEHDAVVVEARYRVHLLPGVQSARVTFPDVGANPGRCLVDGRPHRIALAEDEQQFYLDLHQTEQEDASASARFDVLLELRPATESMTGGHGYRLNVVPVANARLEQQFTLAMPTIHLEGGRGESSVSDDRFRLSALLGSTTQFRLLWSSNQLPVQAPARLEARVSAVVEARPTCLQLRYRVDYRRVGGQVEFVVWNLPHAREQIAVREVTLDGQRVDDHSLSPAGEAGSRMLVQFAAPRQSDFAVEALLLVPLPPHGGNEFRVPTASLVEENIQTYQPYSVAVSQNLLGVAAGPEFIVTPVENAASEDGFKKIGIETYRKRTGERTSARTPQFAYEVTAAGPGPSFEMSPAVPVRKIRKMIQAGIVRGDSLSWTLGAEIETSRAPAFRHRLRVPPQLTIDDISVREDQAERLVHWSRRGRFVELFLSDKTTGIQSVTLKGTHDFSRAAPLTLPLIEIERADVEESQLKLLYDPEWTIRLDGADSLEAMDSTAPADENGGDLELLGQFRLRPDGEPPRIRVELPGEQFETDSVVAVSRQTAGSWRIDYHYRFRRLKDGPPIGRIRLRIPAEVADSHRVDSPGLRQRAAVQADGSIELDLIPQSLPDKSPEELDVKVSASIDEPLRGKWSPPLIATEDDAIAVSYLLVSDELELKPDLSADNPIIAAPWPEQVTARIDSETLAGKWTLYSQKSSGWIFLAGSPEAEPGTPQIPLVESRVMQRPGDAIGSTTLWIEHLSDGDLELNWPGTLELRSLFVDGQPVASARHDAKENSLSIPISAGRGAHRAEIHWSRASTPGKWWLPQSLQLPTPRHRTVGRSLVAVTLPLGSEFTIRESLESCNPLEYALDLLEGLYAVCRLDNGGEEHSPLWNELENHRRFVRQALTEDSRQSTDDSNYEALRTRFDRVDEQIAALRMRLRGDESDSTTQRGAEIAANPQIDILRAAPNRNLLMGRVAESTLPAPVDLSYWSIDRRMVSALCLLVGLPLLLPVVRRLIRLEIGGWLFGHQPAAWALLGILWWSCLRAGELGIVLLAFSVVLAVRERRQPQHEPTSSAEPPPIGSAEEIILSS